MLLLALMTTVHLPDIITATDEGQLTWCGLAPAGKHSDKQTAFDSHCLVLRTSKGVHRFCTYHYRASTQTLAIALASWLCVYTGISTQCLKPFTYTNLAE